MALPPSGPPEPGAAPPLPTALGSSSETWPGSRQTRRRAPTKHKCSSLLPFRSIGLCKRCVGGSCDHCLETTCPPPTPPQQCLLSSRPPVGKGSSAHLALIQTAAFGPPPPPGTLAMTSSSRETVIRWADDLQGPACR